MEIATVGKVLVPATIENLNDVSAVRKGTLSADHVRRVEVADARVDTGATFLVIPKRLVRQLGLDRLQTKQAKTPTGIASFEIYEPVRLTIQGRDCEVRVTEVDDSCPVLIGYIPLEMLDFVVDPRGERLIGNPDHGGEQMIDMY